MAKTTVVDSFERLIVWSWVAGCICTSGGSAGRLPDRKTSTTVGLPNFYRNTQKEGVQPNVQPKLPGSMVEGIPPEFPPVAGLN